jgi:cell division septum initiation protein DivIVA
MSLSKVMCRVCDLTFESIEPFESSDIVDRLRSAVMRQAGYRYHQVQCLKAADEIERLRADIKQQHAEIDRLRALIANFANAYDSLRDLSISGDEYLRSIHPLFREARRG